MVSSYSGILAFPHLISLVSSWKVKRWKKKKGYSEWISVNFVATWKQTREDRGEEKQEENSWEVWWGASVSLAVFSCPRTEANLAQNERLSSAALGGMLDVKQRQLALGQLVLLFNSRREKKIVRQWRLMVNLPASFFYFQNFILVILLFATTLANADQNEGETQLMLYLLSFTADDCNLCLEDFLV